jgi:hypothetical protein
MVNSLPFPSVLTVKRRPMGRGLSPLQRSLLRMGSERRIKQQDCHAPEVPGLMFRDALVVLWGDMGCGRRERDTVSQARYNVAKASLSRSLRRLRQRQLVTTCRSSIYLTDAGIEEARRLAATKDAPMGIKKTRMRSEG